MVALVPWGLLGGAVAGATFGLIRPDRARGTRRPKGLRLRNRLVADRYEVLVDSEHAARTQELLGKADEQWRKQ